MASEYDQHRLNGTFSPPLDLPTGFSSVHADWVFKIKRDGRLKARLVVKGYRMEAGVHYNSTFATVPRLTTLRTLLALAAKFDWEIKQGDIATAFLSAEMDCEVYCTLPHGFNAEGGEKDKSDRRVYRLLKGVPGIPQGSYLFQKKVLSVVQAAGATQLPDDASVYKLESPTGTVFLLVWVDDLFMFFPTSAKREATQLWRALQASFQLGDWENVGDCLGCQITRDRPKLKLGIHQKAPIEALLERAGMSDCNPVPTPVATGFRFTKEDCPSTADDKRIMEEKAAWYRSILAGCIYFSTCTRPDIAFAVSKLSKFVANPGDIHVAGLKRLLRYLKGTADHGLVYCFSARAEGTREGVYGFFDASFADDIDTRRSTIAYLFYFEGCVISWRSKLHTYITTSTNHSEYVSGSKAAEEAKQHENTFNGLGQKASVKPILLLSDSLGAIALAQNPSTRAKNKHVDLAHHYARELVELGTIVIIHTSSKTMRADALTKALGPQAFTSHLKFLVQPTFDAPAIALVTREQLGDLLQWHSRLGHRNFEDVAHFLGIPMPARLPFCRTCVESKATKHRLGTRANSEQLVPRPGHTFHADIAGPFRTTTRGGNKHLSILVCAAAKKIWGAMFRSTGQFEGSFRDFVQQNETDAGVQNIARLHSDGASYYRTNRKLMAFCRLKGINQTSSPPHTPELNGLAERTIRTVVEMARSMLVSSGAPQNLYGEAMMYAIVTLNRLPYKSGASLTRNEKYCGKRLPDQHKVLRPFGCAAWAIDFSENRDKLAPKSTMHVMLGFDGSQNSYRLGSWPALKILRSGHVSFDENFFPFKEQHAKTLTASGGPQMMQPQPTEVTMSDSSMGGAEEEDAEPHGGEGDESQGISPSRFRRSRRGWQPSQAALENLASP